MNNCVLYLYLNVFKSTIILQVEFSPPVRINSRSNECNEVENYRMILAPFQKQTQVEFSKVKLKETAVRCLTVINPLDRSGQVSIALIHNA